MNAALLETIFDRALAACDPATLVESRLQQSVRRFDDVIALGKAAESMLEGATRVLRPRRTIAIVPAGYERAAPIAERIVTTHPELSDQSFEAGARVVDFVRSANGPALVLISGGASACVESPLEPWFTRSDLVAMNRLLVRGGLDIEAINTVRKHLSAIKGGRLGTILRSGSSTFVLSDVPRGKSHLVGSGPTIADPSSRHDAAKILRLIDDPAASSISRRLESSDVPETPKSVDGDVVLLADNATLLEAAAAAANELGMSPRVLDYEITGDVDAAAKELLRELGNLRQDELLIAGGEPTVRVTGSGRGGRCSELGLRVAFAAQQHDFAVHGLFAGSDGRDGNSDAAGVVFSASAPLLDERDVEDAIRRSDTFPLVTRTGRPIIIRPTGNNLRDLYLLARESQA